MYRYSADNAVTYTSEDFVLFRESPFAAWMERLALENPDHGIPPDVGSSAPLSTTERQDDVADTLRAEGRVVALIDWGEEESRRRAATLDAMRSGVDFIVNGQLALGPLSGVANLLMRTSGYSDLGGFLYIPCDTQARSTPHCAFRLCFLADLLHSLQGQLPPQMLIIRGGSELEPMQTEEHIYHYRAVKQRFMETMRNFRKHRMPDPAESSHFGRWSDCANEVLRQRALRVDEPSGDAADELARSPLPLAVTADGLPLYELDETLVPAAAQPEEQEAMSLNMTATSSVAAELSAVAVPQPSTGGYTLAEQALMLAPGAYAAEARQAMPGFTPNLVACGYVASAEPTTVDDGASVAEALLATVDTDAAGLSPVTGNAQTAMEIDRRNQDRRLSDRRDPSEDGYQRGNSDEALENLQFIGSSRMTPAVGEEEAPPPEVLDLPEGLAEPVLKPHPLDSADFNISIDSVIDMDIPVAVATPPPVLKTADIELVINTSEKAGYDPDEMIVGLDLDAELAPDEASPQTAFNDSLITNDHYLD